MAINFSVGNKKNESFSVDDSSDVVMGGDVRYTLVPINPSTPIDTISYNLKVIKGK